MITLLGKKLVDFLVLNFKAMFTATVDVKKNDFFVVLTGKSKHAVTELLSVNAHMENLYLFLVLF